MFRVILSILVLLVSISLQASPASRGLEIGDGVQPGEPLNSLKEKLKAYCGKIKLVNVAEPSYPLASSTEQHLLCSEYRKTDIWFDKAAFVVADGIFVQMEAHGISIEPVSQALPQSQMSYLGMAVFNQGSYWLDKNNQRLLWLSKAALHPNLFAWHNNYLDDSPVNQSNLQTSTVLPPFIKFDKSLSELKPVIEKHCKQTEEQKASKIWLPNKPSEQTQINCFGFTYAGFERKFELVFGDGKLQVVWILTAKAEEDRVRNYLVADWGNVEKVNENWEVYGGGRVSLRKDKPELLVLSDEMIPLYQTKFEAQK